MKMFRFMYALLAIFMVLTLTRAPNVGGVFDLARWIGPNAVLANEGGGDGGDGGGTEMSPSVKHISLSSFLKRSRDRLIDLAQQDSREDTKIIIKGFSASDSEDIIKAAALDPTTVKKVVRLLASKVKKETKMSILQNTLKRLEARRILYEKSVQRLVEANDREYARRSKALSAKTFGWEWIPRNLPSSVELDKEKIRLQRTNTVYWFVVTMLRKLH